MLKLYEDLFLLSIDDAKGKLVGAAAAYLPYGLAGAMLAELTLLGKIRADRQRLAILDAMPTADELLDEALTAIARADRPRKLSHWIAALGTVKLRKRVAQGLAVRNVLRIEKKRFLWVIPYEAYPQQDASAKYWVKERLRATVLGGDKPEPWGVAVLSLLRACRLLDLVFTPDERKAAGQRIEALVNGDLLGEAVAETLAEVDEATAAEIAAISAAMYS